MTLVPAMLPLRLVNKRRPLTGNTPALPSVFSRTRPDSAGSVGGERMEVGRRLEGYHEDLSSEYLSDPACSL